MDPFRLHVVLQEGVRLVPEDACPLNVPARDDQPGEPRLPPRRPLKLSFLPPAVPERQRREGTPRRALTVFKFESRAAGKGTASRRSQNTKRC